MSEDAIVDEVIRDVDSMCDDLHLDTPIHQLGDSISKYFYLDELIPQIHISGKDYFILIGLNDSHFEGHVKNISLLIRLRNMALLRIELTLST